MIAGSMGPEDESAGSSLVVYGGVGGDTPSASVSLAPAKTHVSASSKAAAQGPDDTIDAPAIPAKSPERDGWVCFGQELLACTPSVVFSMDGACL